ncbi:hypothetical protein BN946_scf184974.g5 [Trametes cinnabarina]|uniref:Fungal-type protein kinase domain-containing protein n=1 Tax=Pycnoporus cinnabarinus TaxID=5643 RepID=A0A060SUH5_PYCCI|nr:hypothetical protein BN946_scf184974.g5 [Trametes cinnabarina]
MANVESAPASSNHISNTSPHSTEYLGELYSTLHPCQPFRSRTKRARRLEMDGKVVLLDYDKFMDRFVPRPGGEESPTKHRYARVHLKNIPEKPETSMYPKLMRKLNTSWIAPGYRFVSTDSKVDPTSESKLRVDGGMYAEADARKLKKSANWSTMEVFIECKTDNTSGDPFDDSAADGQPSAEERRKVLGQIMTYAYLIFTGQQRTHLFNVTIFGSHARISRWDRAGVTTTKRFNYKKEPEKLLEFFWRLSRLTPAQRGHDASATLVGARSSDYKLMRSRADKPRLVGGLAFQEHAREAFQKSLKDSRWWKLKVDDESDPASGPKTRYFLVGRPHFTAAKGLVGRATRGYVGIDLEDPDGPFVYVKDAWRVDHEGIRKEGEILGYLNAESVENIPTRVCHGDVLPADFQRTVTHEVWWERNPGATTSPVKVHRHYRLVVKEVCLPMKDFKNGKELVKLIARCIEAHGNAYKKGIMHRDVSAGNVLISVNESVGNDGKLRQRRDGVLTDWELSKNVDPQKGSKGPRQPDRTGTWQFLSAHALAHPSKNIDIEDEMESFFHVLLYYAIRYLPTNCPSHALTPFMYEYFDGYTKDGDNYAASVTKHHAMKHGELMVSSTYELEFYTSPPRIGSPTPALHPISDIDGKEAPSTSSTSTSVDLATPVLDANSVEEPSDDLDPLTWLARLQAEFNTSSKGASHLSKPDRKELEEAVAPLKAQGAMTMLYVEQLARDTWPAADKIPDQMRSDFDPAHEAKKPKPPKAGNGPHAGPSSMPPPSQGSNASRKRNNLHDGDPFEEPSSKRSATSR